MERTIYEQSRDLTETCQVVHASSGSVRSWQMCFTSDAFESASADQKRGGNRWQPVQPDRSASRSKHVPDLHRGHAHLVRKATRFRALLILFVLAALARLLWSTVNYISLLFRLLVNSLEPCYAMLIIWVCKDVKAAGLLDRQNFKHALPPSATPKIKLS